jgi:PAS domain S-box-containing protein
MSQPTILIVEGNAITRERVRGALTGEGYVVLEAPDGRTALELMARNPPELILQDLVLPDMDGFDLVGRLRALPGGADLPIIAFSGFLSSVESSQALSLGFMDFVVKPVEPSRLTAIVRSYAGAASVEPSHQAIGRRVLLVDDDPMGRKLAQIHLQQRGFTVITAGDGAEALEIARLSPPDAILSDVLMPRLDGFQLCAAVREDPRLAHVPVILYSSHYVEDPDRRLAERSGASALTVRAPGMEEAIRAVMVSLEGAVSPAPVRTADVLEFEHLHRVVRQLERQVSVNAGLIQRVLLQAGLLSLVAGLPDSVAGAVDIEAAPGAALAGLLDVAGLSVGALYLADADGHLGLQVQLGDGEARAGDAAEFFGHLELFELGLGSEHALAIPSIGVPPEAGRDFLARLAVGSAVIVTLTPRGGRLGVLLLGSQRRDITHPDWLVFARSLGAQLGQTIALSRTFGRLTASERRYRNLFDTTPIGLFRATAQGHFLEANPELLSLLGCADLATLFGSRTDDFYFDPEDWRRVLTIAEREGRAFGFEVRLRRRDGAVIWGRLNVRALRVGDNVVYEGSVEDVTDRRGAEQRMAAEHAVTRALAESADLAQATPRILEAICTSLGWQVGELWRVDRTAGVLRRLDAWHVPSEALREFASMSRDMTFASGVDMPGRVWATGEPVWVPDVSREPNLPRAALAVRNRLHRGFAFPIRADGEVLGVLAFFSDEIHEPDEGLRRTMASVAAQIGQSMGRWRAQAEVERQAESLMQSEKLAVMGQLLAGVAHELNNPLSVVLGQAALLRNQLRGGPLDERAGKIVNAADRCARIVRNFLALARQRPAQRERADINAIVREAVELLAYPLRVDSIEVALDLAEEIAPLWADANQLHQVVVNLLTNAHQALRQQPPPRRITITTRGDAQGGVGTLTVADNGPGIPPEIRTRIFEPFFTTKAVGQGTGLGLSLCQGIIEAHGGVLRLDDAPAGGAVFRIELPVLPPPAQEVATVNGVKDAPITGKRILVVDDEGEVATILAELLSVDRHEVDTAQNGADALEKIRRQRYDLVVSDLLMPEMDGPGLYGAVEASDPELARRFVFITGDTLGATVRDFLDGAGRPTLTKPFDFDEVLRVIQGALRAVETP